MTAASDVVEWWKKHFEEPFNPEDMTSLLGTVPGISGVLEYSVDRVILVARNLHSGKAKVMDDIILEVFKTLAKAGVV